MKYPEEEEIKWYNYKQQFKVQWLKALDFKDCLQKDSENKDFSKCKCYQFFFLKMLTQSRLLQHLEFVKPLLAKVLPLYNQSVQRDFLKAVKSELVRTANCRKSFVTWRHCVWGVEFIWRYLRIYYRKKKTWQKRWSITQTLPATLRSSQVCRTWKHLP